jgi:hypothetical protein
MRERLSRFLRAIHDVSTAWAAFDSHQHDELQAVDSSVQPRAISAAVEQLVKELTTLAAVLTPVMSQAQLEDIFIRIRRMHADGLARCDPSLWYSTSYLDCSVPCRTPCLWTRTTRA